MAVLSERDALAAQVLAAIVIRDGTPCNPTLQVKAAYHYADLMLRELKEENGESDQ